MNLRVITVAAALSLETNVACATDPFTDQGFEVKAYGGQLYEPRYCDPSGPLPMSACVMANLNMAEDFLLRVIHAKQQHESVRSLSTDAIRTRARQACDKVYAEAVIRYRSGDLIDIEYRSCIRTAYHRAALDLLK